MVADLLLAGMMQERLRPGTVGFQPANEGGLEARGPRDDAPPTIARE